MARLIEGEQVDGLSSEVGSEHAAADIDSDQVGNDGIGDLIVVPTVHPRPKCASGMMAVFAPSAKGMSSMPRICSMHASSMLTA